VSSRTAADIDDLFSTAGLRQGSLRRAVQTGRRVCNFPARICSNGVRMLVRCPRGDNDDADNMGNARHNEHRQRNAIELEADLDYALRSADMSPVGASGCNAGAPHRSRATHAMWNMLVAIPRCSRKGAIFTDDPQPCRGSAADDPQLGGVPE
jgi:hypothetical protein